MRNRDRGLDRVMVMLCAAASAPALAAAAASASDGIRITTVHRPGDPAPDLPGYTMAGASGGSINNAGQVLFAASIAGPGISSGNDHILVGGALDKFRLIARERDPVSTLPGFIWLPGSANLTGFNNLVVTSTGEIGFNPTIWETGVSTTVLTGVFAGSVPTPSPLLWNSAQKSSFTRL